LKKAKRIVAGTVHRVGGTVRRVLAASHSKKEIIVLRRQKLKKLYAPKEDK
jgi:hypothetical protein